MNRNKYVVTGISRLTGERQEISLPTTEEHARALLESELKKRKGRKKPAFLRLRVERKQPVQLKINFDYEKDL